MIFSMVKNITINNQNDLSWHSRNGLMAMEIVECSDWQDLAGLIREAYSQAGPEALGWAGASDAAIDELTSEQVINGIMEREKIYLARDSGKVMGFASWHGIGRSGLAELSGVIVLEEQKGRGIGSLLVEKVLDDAREAGYSSIGVKTEEYNAPAISFYRKCGFAFVKTLDETVDAKKIRCLYLERSLG